jgi:hypothetical protein
LEETLDAQDVTLVQLDGTQIHEEELASDQFQFVPVPKSTLLMDTLAYHAQETTLLIQETTRIVSQLLVPETIS